VPALAAQLAVELKRKDVDFFIVAVPVGRSQEKDSTQEEEGNGVVTAESI